MTPSADELLGGSAVREPIRRSLVAVRPRQVVESWGTVELERAAVEVAGRLRHLGRPALEVAPDDELLGARARRLEFPAGRVVMLLEPATEGPLAAALARFGEGFVAWYLLAAGDGTSRARDTGLALSAPKGGPFGVQRRILVGPSWGPHLLLVDAAEGTPAATIGP